MVIFLAWEEIIRSLLIPKLLEISVTLLVHIVIHLSIVFFWLLIIFIILQVAGITATLVDILIVAIIVDGCCIIVFIIELISLDSVSYSAGTGWLWASLRWGTAVVAIARILNFLIKFWEPFYGVEFDEFEATFV